MKIGLFFEYLFSGSHQDSEFAYFCLFVMLLFLLASFMDGVHKQLKLQDEATSLKQTPKQCSLIKTDTESSESLFSFMAAQEADLDSFVFERNQNQSNSVVHSKMFNDCLLLRIDTVSELSPNKIFKVLQEPEKMVAWYSERCSKHQLLNAESQQYHLLLQFPPPVNAIDTVCRRHTKQNEAKLIYKIIYARDSTQTTDKQLSFQSFGITLRPPGSTDDNTGLTEIDTHTQLSMFLLLDNNYTKHP